MPHKATDLLVAGCGLKKPLGGLLLYARLDRVMSVPEQGFCATSDGRVGLVVAAEGPFVIVSI